MKAAAKEVAVTVAVCTWNRCESLRRTLERMTEMDAPGDATWELLVVNNGCTDATDQVITSFCGRLPIRRAWEPQPGLANARNRAVAEATGRYIAFTDDDILVERDWLAAYIRAFRRWPDAAIFGGPIEPLFEGEPPAWIETVIDRIGPVFGQQTLGERPVALTPSVIPSGPYGGNMAVRRDALRRYPFDPRYGVRHGVYGIGEETELMRTMLEGGLRGWWTPEPRVWHWVPTQCQTEAHVRRWMIGSGRYIALSPERDRSLPENVLHRLAARVLRYELQYRIRRWTSRPEVWTRDLVRASRARGRLLVTLEARTRARE